MAKYKYRAMTESGKRTEGELEAKSRNEVVDMITANGYYPLKVEKVVEHGEFQFSFGKKVTSRDISIFCRQLYTMINAGVSINRSLGIIANQVENKALKEAVSNVEEDVKKGEMLSVSLNKHKDIFPRLLVAMVKSGEVSGNMDTMLLRMSDHYEKEYKQNNKIKSAMTYPAILSVVAITAVVVIMTFVMPTFIEIFDEQEVDLPITTQVLLNISDFMQNNFIVLIVAIILAVMVFKQYKKTEKGIYNLSKFKLSIPILGKLNKKIIVARFTRTLSTLVGSGVSLIHALPVVGEVLGNKIAENALMNVRESVIRGEGLSEPIRNTGIFPEMLSSMISIGEETGQLEDILNKTADFYDEEVEQAILRTTTLIEPLLIVALGIVIGFIVISIMMPLFDMYSSM